MLGCCFGAAGELPAILTVALIGLAPYNNRYHSQLVYGLVAKNTMDVLATAMTKTMQTGFPRGFLHLFWHVVLTV